MAGRARPSNGSIIDWQKRRREIAQRALPLFLTKPWTSISVEEIAAETDMSFWQIYYSFDGQEDVYRASATFLLDQLSAKIANPPKAATTVLQTINLHVDFMADLLKTQSYRDILYLRIRDEPTEPWLGIQYRKKFVAPAVDGLKTRISEAGYVRGLNIGIDDKRCQDVIAALEASLALPCLLQNNGIDDQSCQHAIRLSAKKIWDATFDLQEDTYLFA